MWGYLKGVVQAWIDFPQREGARLGEYEIIRFAGMGSYGLTYMCRDRITGTLVAVKQAKPSKGELGRRLLLREEEALRAMSHRSIPRCLERFEAGRRLCLAVEWVDGMTVEELIFEQGRGFTEAESLSMVGSLLPIVDYVHRQGWVHLDLRIPNVMRHEGMLKLIDFGLARRIGDDEGLQPAESEEERRRRMPEIQSDYYALGHFLLFLLYSSYEPQEDQPPRDWSEELVLSEGTAGLLRRLLQLERPYEDARELGQELELAMKAATGGQELE